MIVLGTDPTGAAVAVANHRRPWHVLGIPGMGKSTLLGGAIALQANAQGDGCLVIDIKDGDLARQVAARADPERLIYFAPGTAFEAGQTWTINPLDGSRNVVVDNVLDMFSRTGSLQSSFTLLRENLSMALRLAVNQPDVHTLYDVSLILTDLTVTRQLLDSCTLPPGHRVRRFWEGFLAGATKKTGELSAAQRTTVSSTMNVLDQWLVDDPLATVLSGQVSSLRLGECLDAGKLVVCNLVDEVPPTQTKRFGNLIMASLITAALSRKRDIKRNAWIAVADEFDQLAGEFFSYSLDKLRAAGVVPVMAHQHLFQIDEHLKASLMAAQIKVYFQISPADVMPLAKMLGKDAQVTGLAKLSKHTARVLTGEEPPGWTTCPSSKWTGKR